MAKIRFVLVLALAALLPGLAQAQTSILQSGTWVQNHIPMYGVGGSGQPLVRDSGPAKGGTVGTSIGEMSMVLPATPTGPNSSNWCDFDGATTGTTGYHYLCLSPNSLGGGLISYGAVGTASPLPLQIRVNGTTGLLLSSNQVGQLTGSNSWSGLNSFSGAFKLPSVGVGCLQTSAGGAVTTTTCGSATGTVMGPPSSSVGYAPLWGNSAGTLLASGLPVGAFGASTIIETGPSGLISTSALPTATTSNLGLVEPDGVSITINGGVISAPSSGSGTVSGPATTTTGYAATWGNTVGTLLGTGFPIGTSGNSTIIETTSGGTLSTLILPYATTSAIGAVKPDGSTILINGSGVISSVANITGPGSSTVGYLPQWGNGSGTSFTAGLPVGTTGNSTVVETSAGGLVASSILPLGSSSSFGAVKVDNSTIVANAGVISTQGLVAGPGSSANNYVPQWSGTGGSALAGGLPVGTTGNNTIVETSSGGLVASSVLPVATSNAFGAVKPDGSTISVSNGVLSTVVNGIGGPGSSTAGYLPTWNNTTGSLLAAGLPVGTTGNSTVVETSSGGLVSSSILPLATTGAFGAVKPDGSTIQITGGVISTVGGGGNVNGPVSSTSGYVPVWNNGSGTLLAAGLPVAGSGASTIVETDPTGHVGTSILPTATSSTLGILRPDNSTITISGGVISAASGGGNVNGPGSSTSGYIPTWNNTSGTLLATGLPVGTSGNSTVVETSSGGTVSASILPTATNSTQGAVKPDGTTISITGSTISAVNTGNVTGPGSSTTGYVPTWSGSGGTALATGLPVGITGNSTVVETSSGGYIASSIIPVATSLSTGAVKPDNSTITISNGVISSVSALSTPGSTTVGYIPLWGSSAGNSLLAGLPAATSGNSTVLLTQSNGYLNKAPIALTSSYVSAYDIGMKCDGSTDDSAALNSALASGKVVVLPETKTCAVASTITISASNEGMTCPTEGDFWKHTPNNVARQPWNGTGCRILWTGSSNGTVVSIASPLGSTSNTFISGIYLHGIYFDSNSTLAANGLVIKTVQGSRFENLYFRQFNGVSFDLGVVNAMPTTFGDICDSQNNVIQQVSIDTDGIAHSTVGIELDAGSQGTAIEPHVCNASGNTFTDTLVLIGQGKAAYWVNGGDSNTFNRIEQLGSADSGVLLGVYISPYSSTYDYPANANIFWGAGLSSGFTAQGQTSVPGCTPINQGGAQPSCTGQNFVYAMGGDSGPVITEPGAVLNYQITTGVQQGQNLRIDDSSTSSVSISSGTIPLYAGPTNGTMVLSTSVAYFQQPLNTAGGLEVGNNQSVSGGQTSSGIYRIGLVDTSNKVELGDSGTSTLIMGTPYLNSPGTGTVSSALCLDSTNKMIGCSYAAGLANIISVTAYGATGNGSTDDTAAIQAAINALPARGGTVWFPIGTYKISSTLTIGNGTSSSLSSRYGVILEGASAPVGPSNLFAQAQPTPGVSLTWAGGASPMVKIVGPLEGWGIQNMNLEANSSATYGLYIQSGQFGDTYNLSISNATGAGIYSTTVAQFSGYETDSIHNSFRNIQIHVPTVSGDKGVVLTGTTSSNTDFNDWDNLFIALPGSNSVAAYGLYLQSCDSNYFHNLVVTSHTATDPGVVFDYTVTSGWPASNTLVSVGTGNFQNVGTPSAAPNYLFGFGTTNGDPTPSLANLTVIDSALPLTGGSLSGTLSFSGAMLYGINFSGASYSGADWTTARAAFVDTGSGNVSLASGSANLQLGPSGGTLLLESSLAYFQQPLNVNGGITISNSQGLVGAQTSSGIYRIGQVNGSNYVELGDPSTRLVLDSSSSGIVIGSPQSGTASTGLCLDVSNRIITCSGSGGTVTSVSGTGTVSGLTLSGTVTTSGSLTLGGTLSLTSTNVTNGLGYTPVNKAGDTLTGQLTFSGSMGYGVNFAGGTYSNADWTTSRASFVDSGSGAVQLTTGAAGLVLGPTGGTLSLYSNGATFGAGIGAFGAVLPLTNNAYSSGANGFAWSNVYSIGYTSNGNAGVSCSGTPTVNFAVTNGIVTHC